MSQLKTPFRYDFVGSFLRPQALKDAKAAYQNGTLAKEAYDKVVEEEITKLVAMRLPTASSAEPSGIWTSCGALRVLPMRTPATVCSLQENWQSWMIPTWLAR